ncbi:MAG: YfcE family phosphodiesterase [Methanosphaera sp.]|nr:YfcE family phosphodiesterase [Methanosphaera sp.]
MLIGVISDTHIPVRSKKIPDKVFEVFEDVDLILHAGDIETLDVIESLKTIAPVIAVHGNCDYDLGLNNTEIIEVENVKIGLAHGVVYPKGDTQQLYYLARQLDVSVLITGHTHQASIQQIKDVLLLNPGSPTQPRMTEPSVMLVEVKDSEVKAEIVVIGSPTCKSLDFSRFKHLYK